MMRRKARGIAAAWVLLLGLACSGGEDDERDAGEIRAGEAVELRGGRVWLDLSEGGQLAALGQLAEAGDFDLELNDFRPQPLTIRLEGVRLAEAVAALVGDASFAFEYAFDTEKSRHAIAILHIGTFDHSPSETSGTDEGDQQDLVGFPAIPLAPGQSVDGHALIDLSPIRDTSSRERVERARERIEALRESLSRAESDDRRALKNDYDLAADAFQEMLRHALSDPDPIVRAATIVEIALDSGDARQRIGDLARSDPNPGVRAAVAEKLGDDGTFQAVADLVGMLDDPEPNVLIATLEALDSAGDESIEPYIEPLSNHPDSRVRETANEILEFWK